MPAVNGRQNDEHLSASTMNNESPPTPASTPTNSVPTKRFFWVYVAGLLLLWLLVIMFRMELRAQWWAYRLTRVTSTDDHQYYLTRLAAIGNKSLGPISRLLDDPRPEIRQSGMTILHYCSHPSVTELLVAKLSDPSPDMVAAAALELALRPKSRDLLPQLGTIALADDSASAWGACVALERFGGPDAISTLLQVLRQTTDADVRAQAIDSLGMLGSQEAVPTLKEMLTDQRPISRLPASQRSALRTIGALQQKLVTQGMDPQAMAEASQSQNTVASVAERSLRLIQGTPWTNTTTHPHTSDRGPREPERNRKAP